MTNSSAFQKLLIYAVVLPLALLLGWVLAADSPVVDLRVWFVVGSIIMVIAAPLILQHYHAWLILSWNMLTVVFFLPGRPPLWMLLAFAGLGIAILQRALNKDVKFLHARSVLAPTLVLVAVVFGTAWITGSFGLASLGGESVGGRGYWYIFGSAAGMLAMMSQRIPQDKVKLYTGLFFLGALTAA
ncbi:MAG TPA: hypothetical protein VN673_00870, partial [Clostridia bacterium]|nr:hypothetical protein [Clostridia bacterium]